MGRSVWAVGQIGARSLPCRRGGLASSSGRGTRGLSRFVCCRMSRINSLPSSENSGPGKVLPEHSRYLAGLFGCVSSCPRLL